MKADYFLQKLAPKGKTFHEELIKYANYYFVYNLDYPKGYILKDVQFGDCKREFGIVDIASIPDGSYNDRPYKSIAIECGNLSGDAIEHLNFLMDCFDVVGWLPYPFCHRLDKYQCDIIEIIQHFQFKKQFIASSDIIHPKNLEKYGKYYYIPKKDIYYHFIYDKKYWGELTIEEVRILLFSKRIDYISKDGFGLFPLGLESVDYRNEQIKPNVFVKKDLVQRNLGDYGFSYI